MQRFASLAGTTPFHRRHLLLCTGKYVWPSHPERDVPFVSALTRTLQPLLTGHPVGKDQALLPVKLTLTDVSSVDVDNSQGEAMDLFVFPDALRIRALSAANDDFSSLAHALTQPPTVLSTAFVGRIDRIYPTHHLFVCTHGERDCRCGTVGSSVYHALARVIHARRWTNRVHVHRCSHIGRHKFAANVVVHPTGDWYGLLTESDAETLLDTVVTEQGRWWPRWRGTLGLHADDQRDVYAHGQRCVPSVEEVDLAHLKPP